MSLALTLASSSWLGLSGLALPLAAAPQDSAFVDPAPPTVSPLKLAGPTAPTHFEGRRFHAAPRPLAEGAVVEDSPGFLGPRRDSHSLETPLLKDWGEEGPRCVWEIECGEGFAAPAAAGGRLIFTHREGDQVHVDAYQAETGERWWRFSHQTAYRGDYIQDKGPRATPLIVGDRVLVHSVEGMLHCLDLGSGAVLWQRDLQAEFSLPDSFFGVVSSPLAYEGKALLNLGANAKGGPSVAAFDLHSGRMVWGAGQQWGASCASPVLGRVGEGDLLFVLTGGKSRPPTGGLMVIDPSTGRLLCERPFRSRTELSVSGATPVVAGGRVFLSSSYGVGTAAYAIDAQGQAEEEWRVRDPALQFPTPLWHEGHLYAIAGSSRVGAIACLSPETGETLSSTELVWDDTITRDGREQTVSGSIGEGSLLHVDGALLCLGDQGHLLRLKAGPEGAQVLARHWMFQARESWTPPVVHRGLLFLRQCSVETGKAAPRPRRLLCYDLRGG